MKIHRLRARARCVCDCGAETTPLLQNLLSGQTRSCGCLDSWEARLGPIGSPSRRRSLIAARVRWRAQVERLLRFWFDAPTIEDVEYLADRIGGELGAGGVRPWEATFAPWQTRKRKRTARRVIPPKYEPRLPPNVAPARPSPAIETIVDALRAAPPAPPDPYFRKLHTAETPATARPILVVELVGPMPTITRGGLLFELGAPRVVEVAVLADWQVADILRCRALDKKEVMP